jgi:hypothetical protein
MPFCPVRARTSRPRGWVWPAGQAHGQMLGAGGVRRLAVAVRTGSRAIVWAVTANWGCPADRTVERSPMSVARPALPGVRRRTDRRRWCPSGWQADRGRVRHTMGWSLRWLPGGPGLGARADERLRCGSLLARQRAGRRMSVGRVGQWVSASGSRPLALAGRPEALLGGGADQFAAGESLGRSCSVEPSSRFQRHPVSKLN